jgi:acyl-CoA dehydrogenase
MLPDLSPRALDLREKLIAFMAERIYPHEAELLYETHDGAERWRPRARMEALKREARRQFLWNLFYAHGPESPGLSYYEYGHLCEVLGRSLAAPEAFNCNAPDVGNMEILSLFGAPEQKVRWLQPLLDGEIRSCFAMTEPAVASSDAGNIETSIRRDGGDYMIDGRKWWITGEMSSTCKVAIVMGKSNPSAPKHKQQSMIFVPMEVAGLTVERPVSVYGYEHPPLGHAELVFRGVRVLASNMLLGEGRGFEIAQSRLGPGRIHHCMRFIRLAERAIEAMCRRAKARIAFGAPLAELGAVRQAIGQSRCETEQARLVTLKAAATMDRHGSKTARNEIAVAKIVVPETVGRILDRAIQVHGGAGLSQDHFLAAAFAETRFLRIGDGPDEVHREALAKAELAKYA